MYTETTETVRKQQWKKMLKAFVKASANALQKLRKQWEDKSERGGEGGASSGVGSSGSSNSGVNSGGKNEDPTSTAQGQGPGSIPPLLQRWLSFQEKTSRLETNLPRIEVGFAFAFVDGLLVEAMRKGHWVLLDEVNLAASETLQALAGVLDGQVDPPPLAYLLLSYCC